MNHIQSSLVVFLSSLLIVACGKPGAQDPAPSAPPIQSPLQGPRSELGPAQLGLKILKADPGQPELPGDQEALDADARVTTADEVVLRTVIPVSAVEGAQLFLAWKASPSPDLEIRNAYFSAEKTTVFNDRVVPGVRELVRLDQDRDLYFIPLNRAYLGSIESVDAAEERRIRLTLQLADGRDVRISILIRLRGPIPRPVRVNAGPTTRLSSATADLSATTRQFVSQGIEFQSETYRNDSERPLRLWLNAGNPRLEQVTAATAPTAEFSHFHIHPDPYYRLSILDPSRIVLRYGSQRRVSRIPAIFQGVRIQSGEGEEAQTQEIAMSENSWVSVIVGAGQTLSLSWIAKGQPWTQQCRLPQPVQKSVSAILPSHELCLATADRTRWCIENGNREVSESYTEQWSLESVGLYGDWNPRVYVSDTAVTATEVAAVAEAPIVHQENPFIQRLREPVPSSAPFELGNRGFEANTPELPCQGQY